MLDSHPFFETAALFSSKNSAGKKYRDATDWIVGGDIPDAVKNIEVTDASIEQVLNRDVKIAFSALPAGVAKTIERDLTRENICVFTNASSHRMDSDVPVVIPEVNPEHLDLIEVQKKQKGGFIVANSNCTTTGLVLAMKPLLKFGLASVIVTTYQALSGAGRNGVSSLQILDNIIPFIPREEDKMEQETKKILGELNKEAIEDSEIDVNASCCRVPTRDGHLESVLIDLDEEINLETLVESFRSFQGIPQQMSLPTAPVMPLIVRTEPDRPQPLLDRDAGSPDRAKGMAVTLGRIRKRDRRLCFFLLVHNTIRGAAGTCILNAELAVARNLIP
jgi:aspartate-semialdehyde dehydrogenase